MSMKRYNWGYYSEPEPNLNNRRITAPRGKVIGGSSSINGLVYVRGHAEDFNRWEELGARGWWLHLLKQTRNVVLDCLKVTPKFVIRRLVPTVRIDAPNQCTNEIG